MQAEKYGGSARKVTSGIPRSPLTPAEANAHSVRGSLFNDFATKQPELAKEWSDRNLPLTQDICRIHDNSFEWRKRKLRDIET